MNPYMTPDPEVYDSDPGRGVGKRHVSQ